MITVDLINMESLLTLLYQYPYYFRMVFIDESIAIERDWMIVEIVFPSSSSVTPAVCSRGVLVPALHVLCVPAVCCIRRPVRMIPQPFIFSVTVTSLIASSISSCPSVWLCSVLLVFHSSRLLLSLCLHRIFNLHPVFPSF